MDAAVRKNLLDRLLNAVKQVLERDNEKGGGVFADSADYAPINVKPHYPP